MNRRDLGLLGEDTAARLLSAKGYEIIERNFRCRYGEIDIIAFRGNCLYFVEVKTRQGTGYGRPCESVTPLKREHMKKAAVFYLREKCRREYRAPRLSFQVIEIVIEHIENAF